MAWLVVDKNGDELLFPKKPHKEDDHWTSDFLEVKGHEEKFPIKLPNGFIESRLGYRLDWNSEPAFCWYFTKI